MIQAFLRCGYSPQDIADQAAVETARIPQGVRRGGNGSRIDQDDWARVVTLWSTEPEYVDDNGAPRTLPIAGPPPSIEALLRRVDSKLTVKEACNSLLRTGAARKVGRRLAVEAHPALVHPPGTDEQSAHHLRVLNALLWNFEHNANLTGRAVPWVERVATAQTFPESALTTYSVDAEKRAMAFLKQEDALMQRLVKSTGSKGQQLRAHLHVIFSAPEYESSRVAVKSSELLLRSPKAKASATPTVSRQPQRKSTGARRLPRKVNR
jgi:hypothetical protein